MFSWVVVRLVDKKKKSKAPLARAQDLRQTPTQIEMKHESLIAAFGVATDNDLGKSLHDSKCTLPYSYEVQKDVALIQPSSHGTSLFYSASLYGRQAAVVELQRPTALQRPLYSNTTEGRKSRRTPYSGHGGMVSRGLFWF